MGLILFQKKVIFKYMIIFRTLKGYNDNMDAIALYIMGVCSGKNIVLKIYFDGNFQIFLLRISCW